MNTYDESLEKLKAGCDAFLKTLRLAAVKTLLDYVHDDIPHDKQTPLVAALEEIKHRL